MVETFIAYACLLAAAVALIALCVIDLRVRLLPNVIVLPFAILAVIFHFVTAFTILDYISVICGGILGYGFLFILRVIANHIYKQDALGLGDVKLMGAAGLWLGIEGIFIALTLGAFAGLLHGLAYGVYIAAKTKTKPDFHRLAIPAGPGFAVGIVASGVWLLHENSFF